MKEQDLEALFRQKRNAEETVSLTEIENWLSVGVIAGASISAAAVGVKWLLTKKVFFMAFGICTVAGVVTTAAYLSNSSEKPPVAPESGKPASSVVAARVAEDIQPAPEAKDTARRQEPRRDSLSVLPTQHASLPPLSPLSPLSPIMPAEPAQSPALKVNRRMSLNLSIRPDKDTTVQLENFDRIVVKGLVRLKIVQGTECKLQMQEDGAQWISWEVNNQKLSIEGKDMDSQVELVLYVRELKDIRMTGFSYVNIVSGVSLKDLHLEVDGFCRCALASHVDNLNLAVRGESQVSVNSDMENVDVVISGRSRLLLSGKISAVDAELTGMSEMSMKGSANVSRISVSGQSKLLAMGFESVDVDIRTTGEAYAEVSVKQHLEATASGTSTIIYSGEVQSIKNTTTGTSEIKAKS